jgi:uncharacterized damage-inducible protein DinB
MAIKDAFIAEMKHESTLTKKILERVPMEKKDWKPHERSMSLGRLATHVAETAQWVSDIANIDDFDFLKDFNFQKPTASNSEELLGIYQKNLDAALESLSKMTDEEFAKTWTVRRGDQVMFSTPKKLAVRGWALSHMIHHRGQLSVYLRLLDVPVPGMYGPSADER